MSSKNNAPKRKASGARNTKQTILRLLGYLKEYKVRFVFIVIFVVICAIGTAVVGVFIQSLIDDYIVPLLGQSNPDFGPLLRYISRIAVIFVAGVVSAYLYNRLVVVMAQGILKKIRDDMFAHMQKLPVRYFDTHTHGDIMSRYTNDTDTLRQMMTQSIPMMMQMVVSITAVLIAMLYISIWLTLIVLGSCVLMFLIVGRIVKASGRYFIKQQVALGDVDGYIEEMIHGQKVVKVFNHEEEAKRVFNKKNDDLCDAATKANTYVNILMPIVFNFGYILYVVLAIVGGIMGVRGTMNLSLSGFGVITLGSIASFLQLSRSFVNPLGQVSNQINFVVMALAGAERIFELLDEKVEEDDGKVTLARVRAQDGELIESETRTGHWAWKIPQEDGSYEMREMLGDVVFEHVDFGYTNDKMVLHDISLYARPGQKVAFVGATGAGKTTITNLINRFYDIQVGTIRYDGVDIKQIEKSYLRRSFGMVLQDVNLFTGTVMENIRYGRLNATDEECIEAAKLANAHGFIEMLPQGYQTVISGDGSGLSQGQCQLISIARAAVADPPVMILDEATSSIDTRTEAIVQAGMDALMMGRTVFVIAHRLSTVRNSDVIMVLDHGVIIERGSHEQLIEKRGRYYQLYTGAFELE